jgi:DNA-binding transcriptional MerR regulator
MYTLGTAAKAAGVSKSTIHRAIKKGLISARSKDDSGYEIDPAELHRVFPPVVSGVPQNSSSEGSMERSATPQENTGNTLEPQVSLEVRLAKAEAQLEALKEIVELERKRAEELKEERDRWASALEASQRQITDLTKKAEEPPKGWFWFRRKVAS